jgi:hypothetical protein
VISFPAPEMCQLEDEDLIIRIADSLFPGQVDRLPDVNGLKLWVDGDPLSPEVPAKEARAIFQTTLALLRAWRPEAGQLKVEARHGLGEGWIRDRAGNQWGTTGSVVTYSSGLGELDDLIALAATAIPVVDRLRSALWIFGQANPDAGEFFMVFEYAALDPALGGQQRLARRLGFPNGWDRDFKLSANNLAPQAGGRHAREASPHPLSLAELRAATAELLRAWIRYTAQQGAGGATTVPPQAEP